MVDKKCTDDSPIEIEGTYEEWQQAEREKARQDGRYRHVVGVERQLLEFLCYPGPQELPFREGTRTLSLWFDGSRWKLSLSCKRGSCVCFITGEELADVFATAAKGLAKESLYWKPNRSRTPG